jgi:methylthioribose-1-phosphate isomerase
MSGLAVALLAEARAIHADDARACQAIAQHGSSLFPSPVRLLTHCNTGALATGGIGTALGVIRAMAQAGRTAVVWVDETRPLLQGARLTAWELQCDGIPYRLICDNMAGALMAGGQVDAIIIGADRIARNGDFANKIGTYSLAALAHLHGIPFYVAAPTSTIDDTIDDGGGIPVEVRQDDEICAVGEKRLAPAGSVTWNPAFDVTPHGMVTAFITELGVLYSPYAEALGNAREKASASRSAP